MALFVYTVMALASAVALIFRHPLADVAAKTAAPIGAVFCFLSLATGSLWGKPMWGAWWVWDARLTSMFVLMLLYIGYMAIWAAIEEPHRAAMIARIVALVGFINVPIVKFSVDWWNSLHQPASVFRMDGPTIARLHAVAAAGHGAGLYLPVPGAAPGVDPRRDRGAQDPPDPHCRDRRALMDFTANHIGFVIASYALSVVFIGGLIVQVLLKDRKLRAEAERLEAQRRKPRT